MRYEDWDILIFPRDCKIPVKEFKVACHVVHDAGAEFSHSHGSFGLPTVCCFVPSLPAGSPFQVSLHCWSGSPAVSQFVRSYSKYIDNVKFEARLLIDGRLVASTTLDRKSTWPHVIANSFDFSKNGDLESLKFPGFRSELLQQSYWSPADDLGRIKIIISEGFPRDSLTMPIERVKNIVAFSFQHAPLDVLEGSSIAWPNPSMWRRAPFTSSMPVPVYSPETSESHAHSPRRSTAKEGSVGRPMPALQRPMFNAFANARQPAQAGVSQMTVGPDPFGDANAYFEWLGGAGMGLGDMSGRTANHGKSSTDTSMPDYAPSSHGDQSSSVQEQPFPSLYRPDDNGMGFLKVPANTPTASGQGNYDPDGLQYLLPSNSALPPDLASSLTNSLLNQPVPLHLQTHGAHLPATEVRSRKENRLQSPSTMSTSSTELQDMRKVSQQMYLASGGSFPAAVSSQVNSPQVRASSRVPSLGEFGADITNMSDTALSADKGTKRVRNFTPASAKAIDEEDEPRRASPMIRLSPFVEDATDVK